MSNVARTLRPSRQDLDWVARSIGEGSRVSGVRALKGGISSSVHLVTVDGSHGRSRVVLRQWTDPTRAKCPEWVVAEANVLQQLAKTDLPAPRLLAFDADPAATAYPSLVMSQLPGRMDLCPKDPDHWLDQLANTLVRIHSTDMDVPMASSWLDAKKLEVPHWSKRPAMWRDAISLMSEPPPKEDPTFIHHDYQHFNLLWQRGELCGVVDWAFGSLGSPTIDVGHCRLNLTVLYSSDVAERFLTQYETKSGRKVEPWWDIHELLVYLPGWGDFVQVQAGRQRKVDFAGMHDRVEETLASALNRVNTQ